MIGHRQSCPAAGRHQTVARLARVHPMRWQVKSGGHGCPPLVRLWSAL
jgi:hypothetical protein